MKKPEILSPKWIKIFITSHALGWITAFLQTGWIVWEVRKLKADQERKEAERKWHKQL